MRLLVVLAFSFIHFINFAQWDDEKVDSPLMVAVRTNNFKLVKQLVEDSAQINENDRYTFNQDPVDVAVENNYQEIAKYLLSKGATSRRGLEYAIKTGDINWVKTLLSYRYYDNEGMIYAVQSKKVEMVKFLIQENFPINISQKRRLGLFRKEYVTPLEESITLSVDDITYELVKAGAPVEEAYRFAARYPDNVLGIKLIDLERKLNELWLLSFEADNLILAKYCLQKGADQNYKDEAGLNAFHCSVKNNSVEGMNYCVNVLKFDPTLRTANGESALMLATSNQNISLVKDFLANPAFKLEEENNLGETVLFYAERSTNKGILELVLQSGANVNHQDFGGNTVLMQAMQNGHLEHYERLKKQNPDLTLKNNKGQNILSYVMSGFYGTKDEVYKLIEAGVDPNVNGTNGMNMAFYALDRCDLELLQLLKTKGVTLEAKDGNGYRANCHNDEVIKYAIQNGCDPNRGDNWNDSYLVKAIDDDKMELAVFLIQNGADVNWKKHGDEPLVMYVVKKEKMDFLRLLVENKAKLNATNRWNENLMEVAEKAENKEIANYLRSKGALTKKEIVDQQIQRTQEVGKLSDLISQKNKPEIIQLLKKYPEVTFTFEQLKLMAIICVETSDLQLLQVLIETHELNVNLPLNFEQQNMLHLASKQGDLNFIRLLVNKGCDYKKKDAFDQLPIDYSKTKEIKKYFKELNP